jgi:hypothetical protein
MSVLIPGDRWGDMTYPSIRKVEIEVDTIALFRKSLSLRQCVCQIVLSRLGVNPYPTLHIFVSVSFVVFSRENGNIPQSYSVHTAITEDILSGSCSITTCGVFVGHIAELENMQRREIKAFVEERVDSLGLNRLVRRSICC